MTRTWPDALPDVFRGATAVSEGWLTASQLRSPRLVRVLHGVYRPAHVPLTHGLQCRAAALVVPPAARLTGRSLATVLGCDLRRPGDPVEVVVPVEEAGSAIRGITLRAASQGPLGSGTWRSVPVASRERMGFDLAARHDLETAVSHLDAAAGKGLLDVEAFRSWLEHRHEDDVRHVRTAAALVDARAGSPPESVCRVRLLQAGIAVVPQHRVRDARGVIARVDLAIPELRIAIEYDGAWHADRLQLERDRARLNRLQAAGWTVVHVTAAVLREPGALVDAVRRAVARAAA
ncbi:endonuclease domain-containing protein [Quadrisphaera sp. DSM 44207]|uniref:endonuclease domain-containing protein n=1 Tax=Quadrisphaera sp. DSM 44207 TaxID=1881057 RepID=UPI00087ED89E|nr:DUF559 domain-containing protein [Quadrisphaera sp. DSM 44207]SDQ11547.1 Protein of unknown function [Quadrisphaera sp. DSM 44207]